VKERQRDNYKGGQKDLQNGRGYRETDIITKVKRETDRKRRETEKQTELQR
jgi:hypothetical protein